MSGSHESSSICQLCEREVPRRLITLHHLRPKQKGGRAEDRTPICKPCHKQLHAVFSNKELAKSFSSITALHSAEALQPFLKWIRKQKPVGTFKRLNPADGPDAETETQRIKKADPGKVRFEWGC